VPGFSFKLEEYDDRIRVSWNAVEAPEKYLLLRLNGYDLGYVESLAGEIEIRDVDWNEENNVTLLPMAEDGELSDEAEIAEVADERTVSPPEVIASPVADAPSAAESTDEPIPESSQPEETIVPEEVALPEPDKESESSTDNNKPVVNDGVATKDGFEATKDGFEATKDESRPSSAKQTVPQYSGGSLKLNTKRGFGLARGLDIAKIIVAMSAAVAMLVILFMRKK
jgi:hypothetical protein